MAIAWKKFNALGSEIVISAVLSNNQTNLLDQAEVSVVDFEKSFSRFIVGNELDKFNKSPDKEVVVSEAMAKLLVAAQQWQNYSQNTFDPTIVDNLIQLGYDKSFTEINPSDSTKLDLGKLKADFLTRPRLEQLKVLKNNVTKPTGMHLDFGGFGKGYIIDQISQTIFSAVDNYWLSAGGDLLMSGNEENKFGWRVGVQNPYQPSEEIFSLNTKGRKIGVATSGVFQRQGIKAGINWHHLIDPRTGMPTDNNILAVTAIADNATKADVLAKTVLILGEQAGLDFVNQEDEAAVLIFLKDGAIVFSSRVKNYL